MELNRRKKLEKYLELDGGEHMQTEERPQPKPLDMSKITIPESLTLVIDTGEQDMLFKRPLKGLTIRRDNLKPYGSDYSIAGYETVIGVERKSYSDLYASFPYQKKNKDGSKGRFHKSLERLAKCRYKFLLIEAPFLKTLTPHPHSKVHPAALWQSIMSMQVRYGIVPMYCDTKKQAEYRLIHLFNRIYHMLQECADE